MVNLSFSYVKWLSFDKIKIDKSFIKEIPTNKYNETIVKAIIQITKTMGIEVLAEGVETEEQVNFLIDRHVTEAQGYYFSPPVSFEACENLLNEQKFINEKI